MRMCVNDTRPTDFIEGIGDLRKARLWSQGIRNLGDLRDAISDSIEFDLKLPADINQTIAQRVMDEPIPKLKEGDRIEVMTPDMEAAETALGFQNLLTFMAATVQGRIMLISTAPIAKKILGSLAIVDLKTKDTFAGGKAEISVEQRMRTVHAEVSHSMRQVEGVRRKYIMGLRLDEDVQPSHSQYLKSKINQDPDSAIRAHHMSKDRWYTAITETLRNGGEVPKHIPPNAKQHLEAATKIIRDDIYMKAADDLAELGKKSGQDPISYVMRIYDVDNIRQRRPEFHSAVLDNVIHKWSRDMGSAPSAFMRKELSQKVREWTDGILTSPHQRAAKNLAEHLDDIKVEGSIGRPGGKRTIEVDEDVLAPFLRNDIREITSKYMNTRIVDLEISKKFGDVNMTQAFSALDTWYAQAIQHAPVGSGKRILNLQGENTADSIEALYKKKASKESWTDVDENDLNTLLTKQSEQAPLDAVDTAASSRTTEQKVKAIPVTKEQLYKQYLSDTKDLEMSRDLMRGMYDIPADPYSVRGYTERFGRALKDVNYIRLGGGFAITALGDIGGAMLVNGVRRTLKDVHEVMRVGIKEDALRSPLTTVELDYMKLDWLDVMNFRGLNLFGAGEYGGQGYSAIERGLHVGSRRMAELSLLSNWTNFAKQVAARGVVRRMVDVAESLEAGKATPDQLATLQAAHISPHQLLQMLELKRRHNPKGIGLGIDKWGKAPDDLVDAVRNVIVREVDRAVLTPGITDAPRFMHSLGGSVLFQFRRFGMSHTQRLLIPAMQGAKAGDLQVLNYIGVSSAMGSIVYMLKELAGGREIPDDPMRIIQEGIVRADIWGKIAEIDGFMSAASHGTLGFRESLGPSTSMAHASAGGYFEGIANALSPATYSTITEGAKSIAGIGAMMQKGLGNVDDSEIMAWRRMSPFNTLFYMDWWFDAMENGVKTAAQRTSRTNAMMEQMR